MFLKIKFLKQKGIEKIYIFTQNKDDLNITYKENPNDDVFNELLNTEDKKYPIIFVNKYIHYDDNIYTIKNKIVELLEKKISFEEIYIFSQKMSNMNIEQIYDQLTQNEKPVQINNNDSFSFNVRVKDDGTEVRIIGYKKGQIKKDMTFKIKAE